MGVGNGLILGYLMYRSGLVPRGLATLGLIGGRPIVISGIAILFGAFDSGSLWQGLATVAESFWELVGIYLTVEDFKQDSPVFAQSHPREDNAGAQTTAVAVPATQQECGGHTCASRHQTP